ncbi:alanine racemase [Mariniphaga sediminis]|uniref:Alanine racemase n=1 Tax=Mariniphaga sediminis TaxID=1628158 RepID=A0A399D665_9BACT|nr:alanine racemase [Mariniphaga sediminis]RIH66996.1 alanine racemase [Mariniphaga sediminis]
MKDLTLSKPTFIIDKKKSIDKIEAMFKKATRQGVQLRPHFKTHQNYEIGTWFREVGVRAITVSSCEMAEYFAFDGWNDITIAFSVNLNEADKINSLSSRINLNILLEDIEVVTSLEEKLTNKVGVFVEIDTGYKRAGLNPADTETIGQLLKKISTSDKLIFKGFLTFAGHSYFAQGEAEIQRVFNQYMDDMLRLKEKFGRAFLSLKLSAGDTPTCSIVSNFRGVDEIRPGNFIFYDLMQVLIGSCKREQVSAIVACPVVAIHKERQEIIIFGGAVHFSKEMLTTPEKGAFYGDVVELSGKGWKTEETGAYVSWMSQEHGVVKAPASFFERIKVGEFIGVIPVHSCLVANLMKGSTLIIN